MDGYFLGGNFPNLSGNGVICVIKLAFCCFKIALKLSKSISLTQGCICLAMACDRLSAQTTLQRGFTLLFQCNFSSDNFSACMHSLRSSSVCRQHSNKLDLCGVASMLQPQLVLETRLLLEVLR